VIEKVDDLSSDGICDSNRRFITRNLSCFFVVSPDTGRTPGVKPLLPVSFFGGLSRGEFSCLQALLDAFDLSQISSAAPKFLQLSMKLGNSIIFRVLLNSVFRV
jgi:hypothetical protein